MKSERSEKISDYLNSLSHEGVSKLPVTTKRLLTLTELRKLKQDKKIRADESAGCLYRRNCNFKIS